MDRLLISFSGGRTSAFMMKWCYENLQEEYEMKCVFANTGKEHQGTLDFVDRCSKEWNIPIVWVEATHLDEDNLPLSPKGWKVSHRIVTKDTAARHGEPYEQMLSVLGIPSTMAPFCSDQLKRKPIESYLKSIGWNSFYKAIGIRIDEVDRVNPSYKEKKIIYPLITHAPMDKKQVISFWERNNFDLQCPSSMGNCDNCWKKSIKVLSQNMNKYPDSFKWWSRMEGMYQGVRDTPGVKGVETTFFRKGSSIKDIKKYSNLSKMQKLIFDKEISGGNGSCGGSCEAF